MFAYAVKRLITSILNNVKKNKILSSQNNTNIDTTQETVGLLVTVRNDAICALVSNIAGKGDVITHL